MNIQNGEPYMCMIYNGVKKQDDSATSLLEQVLKKLVGEARTAQDRKAQTSFCIIDAQSVKNKNILFTFKKNRNKD